MKKINQRFGAGVMHFPVLSLLLALSVCLLMTSPARAALVYDQGTADDSYILNGYQVWVFNNGFHEWEVPDGVTHADIMLVAGGGAGAGSLTATLGARGGGGGAGGLIFLQNYELTPGSYALEIGTGGASTGANGEDTTFGSFTAVGGGGGGGGNNLSTRLGRDGGSGGGGSGNQANYAGGDGTVGQGTSGGAGFGGNASQGSGGGGGGFSQAGFSASSINIGGNGGSGFNASSYCGIGFGDGGWGAGGGGGSGNTGTSGIGGQGGGGNGVTVGSGGDAMANTGGGGGGVRNSGDFVKVGYGADGIVVIRAMIPAVPEPGTALLMVLGGVAVGYFRRSVAAKESRSSTR